MSITRRQLMRLAVGLGSLPLAGCAGMPGASSLQSTLFAFNTVCVLGGAMPQDVLDQACRMCARYEELFSRTREGSDVWRINNAGGKPVAVDYRTTDVVGRALSYCEESGGLFDITIGAVSELWDFSEGVVPERADVERALPHVGWERVELDGDTIALGDPQARLDLGGIAKGYVADRLMEYFVRSGVTSAYVNLGGNVKVYGYKQDGTPWHVGVRDPKGDDDAQVVARVSTTDGSLVTSGLYQRSFERDGRTYWHILDPRTGYPVQTDVVSASIFSHESIDGDGYTKPLFMWSTDDVEAFFQAHPALQGLLVHTDGSLHMTPGAEFELTDDATDKTVE